MRERPNHVDVNFRPQSRWTKGIGKPRKLICYRKQNTDYVIQILSKATYLVSRLYTAKYFSFQVVEIPFLCRNIQEESVYGKYISQLIRYLRTALPIMIYLHDIST